jgi:molybdopterin-synthase adenylyltransferase
MLTSEELERYGRQIIIPNFGEGAQEKIKRGRVLVAGVGGLGCTSALFLAGAGVGHIRLVDSDTVGLSNLNRQMLYGQEDVGRRKVEVASERLSRLNPNIELSPVFARITDDNVYDLLADVDLVVDGLDNFPTRLVLNSACVRKKITYIYGGVFGLKGAVTAVIPGRTYCLSCIYPIGREEKRPVPVLGAIPAVIASLQVVEAIKILAGLETSLAGRMLFFQGDRMEFFSLELKRNEQCKVCGKEFGNEDKGEDELRSSRVDER